MTLKQEIINILDNYSFNYYVNDSKNSSKGELIQLLKNEKEISWSRIVFNETLSEEFIKEFKDKVNWYHTSCYQLLSENFIKKFKDRVNWYYISKFQKLSEDFIREFQDEVCWDEISICQTLSENFIREFKDKVDWRYISKFQKLSENFIKEFNLEKPQLQSNWLYVSKKDKEKFIKKYTDYEIKDNCIIAYKSVRNNLSSVFKPGFQYEIGKTYTSNCDCNLNNYNSFGLAAWNKRKALDYYRKGKLLKVSIPIEKLGACIIDHKNKLRAFEMTILEEVEFLK